MQSTLSFLKAIKRVFVIMEALLLLYFSATLVSYTITVCNKL